MFIPLYPVGVAAEVAIIWKSLPHLQKTRLHSLDLPNSVNFAFDYHLFNLVRLLSHSVIFSRDYQCSSLLLK